MVFTTAPNGVESASRGLEAQLLGLAHRALAVTDPQRSRLLGTARLDLNADAMQTRAPKRL